jgi:citrate lyase subunit alpha / citrate CoA-transferase
MKNILGREIPEKIEGYKEVVPYSGVNKSTVYFNKTSVKVKSFTESKVVASIKEVLVKAGLKDGMTISFHHHLRNGDFVLNQVMEAIDHHGVKDLTLASSSIFPIHSPLVNLIEKGVVSRIVTGYMSGDVAKAVSEGKCKYPAIMMTHGGRPRAIEEGDLNIDIAFIAAPTCDTMGNLNGTYGKSSCGVLGYAIADAEFASIVVAITDNLVSYPTCPIEINQTYIDYVVKVDSIGDPKGIVAGTTQVTKDPIGLKIANTACEVIENSGYLKNGFSFQTGAGGTALAVAIGLKELMLKNNIQGSFASGGITGYIVDMLEEGLFQSLFDTQCFDLKAINSYKNNEKHQGMSASLYSNPNRKGCVVDNLDIMILGATEIDLNFNVNVVTGSSGYIMGGSGGHSDTAFGSKLSIVVTSLIRSRLPIVKDAVTTVTTPGETIDVLVTEYGVAINPLRKDLILAFEDTNLPIKTILELKEIAEKITGVPKQVQFSDKVVAVVEYRDGTVIDVVRKPL